MGGRGDRKAASRSFAGLYARMGSRTSFWGWGEPHGLFRRVRKEDKPLAGLAAWLRRAHESLDGAPAFLTAASETLRPAAPMPAAPGHDAARGWKERRLRFVWSRHFIGLLIGRNTGNGTRLE